jgi:putative tryptophan/tyrosine transport system substrate-binding protein
VTTRREFITVVGGGAAAWPLAARGQQPPMPVIGFLGAQGPGTAGPFMDAFRRGLAETGHVEGQNLAIEYRLTGGQLDRLPTLAADLVRLQVSVIATSGSTAAVAAEPRPGRFRLLSAFPKTQSSWVWSQVSLGRAAMRPASISFQPR